ncbi:hypothetical protein [Stutzerimonas stutzeri]|uniref:Uncharacterized protein n=1 Tax=Stutzerimonas stutzeri KOS6 TaxID=1218352 RepID=A0A061JKJ3_STUST|nr:hypothetical protein [Stutzerimonas stutzeri]EWC39048.1 hypothetical protein B597_022210 [Stutzerimonas stutzeri KOS6]
MSYNTGNTVPSTDARDFMGNVRNLDLAINTESLTWSDRRGIQRKTWAGLEAEFFAWLGASSFELPALEYTGTGPLQVLRPTQLIYRTGFPETYYSVKPSESFPATLSGSWASDEERLVLRSDGALALGTAALLNAGTGPDDLPKRSQADQLYQPKAATLSSLADLNGTADRLPYFTGEDAMALAVLSTFARTLLDDEDAASARATLGAASAEAVESLAIKSMYEVTTEFTLGGLLTLAHGLGAAPRILQVEAVCTSAIAGYVVGDVFPLAFGYAGTTGSSGLFGRIDATQLRIRVGTQGAGIVLNADTGGGGSTYITPTNFNLRIKAFA